MRKTAGGITHRMWAKVERLAEVNTLLRDDKQSAAERKQLLCEQHSINSYLTPPRVAEANRWRRRVISIAMRQFPSMHLPPITQFVRLPAVQVVIVSPDAPPHWSTHRARAAVSIRLALRRAGFLIK